jgi:hypothetical protein
MHGVLISGPLLAQAIPNLVYENYAEKGEKRAGTTKSGSQVWALKHFSPILKKPGVQSPEIGRFRAF